MSDISDLLGGDPAPEDNPAPATAAPAKAAKKGKKGDAPEPALIPPALAAAVEEKDPVFQAHLTRQANHHGDLAPSIAKQAREDKEREELLQEHEKIAERNRKTREEAESKQKAIEEREGAAARIEALDAEIETIEASLEAKQAEAARLKKLVKE